MHCHDETDRSALRWMWHWSLWPLCEMCGVGLVYSIGLKVLGYPPTWVDLVEEKQLVEAAVLAFLKEKKKWA